ncbi:MAG: metal ABC transporter permease [Eubacteriales bacterium]|nr:metal ABC transporter permease [Eubacteriales bacterium]
MFEFEFMRRALVVGTMLSIMIPLIGVIMVNRKTSMVGDALSHSSLAGVGIGLIMGFDPVIGAILICIVAAFSIEKIRKRFPQYGDMATAITMSFGLGLAAILSDFAPGGNTFEAYLFGSISSVQMRDVYAVSVVFALVVLTSIIMYAGLLAISVDSNLARISGVRINLVNGIFTLLAAITIAMATKIVGALLVASLIVLPVATSLMIARSYKQAYIISVLLGVIYMWAGITTSFYQDIKPGGAIVLYALLGMLITAAFARVRKIRNRDLENISGTKEVL